MLYLFSLGEWWQTLDMAGQTFWVIAIIASVLFVILFGMSLLGVQADTDVDMEVDHGASHGYSLDKDFSALSLRSIVAFLTFFGWTGVYLVSSGMPLMFVILISAASGAAAMFVVAYMIFKFAQMEKSGTVNVYHALDNTGEVYLTIPSGLEGKGKVHIIVDGAMHEFDAETKGQMIPTGMAVRVTEILDEEVLLVEPVELEKETGEP